MGGAFPRTLAMAALAAGLAAGAATPDARACGHCIEDKVAAVYDHAVVESARRAGHRVVYLEWRRIAADAMVSPVSLRAAIVATLGVLPRTVRVSAEPAVVAFAYDPARHGEAALIQAVNRRLVTGGAVLVRLDVAPSPEKRGPAAARTAGKPTRR